MKIRVIDIIWDAEPNNKLKNRMFIELNTDSEEDLETDIRYYLIDKTGCFPEKFNYEILK